MNELLDEMEQILSDLTQSGFSTGAEYGARRATGLSEACEAMGLHTASKILKDIATMLSQRPHQVQKDDGMLMEKICMAVRYMELAREKMMQQSILDRWDRLLCGKEGENP